MSARIAQVPMRGSWRRPWRLAGRGLEVFHGTGEAARLSHYFLPHLLLHEQPVLLLDGANCANPRLLSRFARRRNLPFGLLSRRMQIARAFTCFQLTELIARVPRFLEKFPARVVLVTALPDLYFDEDIRDREARASFEQALALLQRWARRGLAVAVFSDAEEMGASAARRNFFRQLAGAAERVWRFERSTEGRLEFVREGVLPKSKRVWSTSSGQIVVQGPKSLEGHGAFRPGLPQESVPRLRS